MQQHSFSRWFFIPGVVAIMAAMTIVGGILTVRATTEEGGVASSPSAVSREEFDTVAASVRELQMNVEGESRAIREEVFNLRQQIVELRINRAIELFDIEINTMAYEKDEDRLVKACAQARDQLAVFDMLWEKIRAFWPLASDQLASLEEFRKKVDNNCFVQ